MLAGLREMLDARTYLTWANTTAQYADVFTKWGCESARLLDLMGGGDFDIVATVAAREMKERAKTIRAAKKAATRLTSFASTGRPT